MADGVPSRFEMRNSDRWFLVRIAPYTGTEAQVRGAVLTFTNFTAFRASLGQAIYEREYTKTILNAVIDPLVVLDERLQVQTANRAFYDWFGASREQTQGIPSAESGRRRLEGIRLVVFAGSDSRARTVNSRRSSSSATSRSSGAAPSCSMLAAWSVTALPWCFVSFRDITKRKRPSRRCAKAKPGSARSSSQWRSCMTRLKGSSGAASEPRQRCGRSIAARMSFWRLSRTSCAIHSRRSARHPPSPRPRLPAKSRNAGAMM